MHTPIDPWRGPVHRLLLLASLAMIGVLGAAAIVYADDGGDRSTGRPACVTPSGSDDDQGDDHGGNAQDSRVGDGREGSDQGDRDEGTNGEDEIDGNGGDDEIDGNE